MEPDELSTRLIPFCEAKYGTSDLEVFDVHKLSMTPLIDRALELLGGDPTAILKRC